MMLIIGHSRAVPAATATATPKVKQVASHGSGAKSSTVSLVLPTGIASGNTLLAFIKLGESVSVAVTAAPAGWTQVFMNKDAPPVGDYGFYVYRKTADGTEGGTTVQWKVSPSAYAVFYVVEVSGGGVVEHAYLYNSFDPPLHTPTGGAARPTVWIAAFGGRRSDNTMTGPAGWQNFLSNNFANTGNVATSANGEFVRIAGATLESTAAAMDPPAFGISPVNSSREVITVSVRA